MTTPKTTAKDFPFHSRHINIDGCKIHYIDEGEGDPMVFIHGIPTSSYLWRNVIPPLSNHIRCIALDLPGMGYSDKPNIAYRVFDYIYYFEKFIKALNLKNITLVMHAWGSVIGFDYAMRHANNIKALAFLEAYIRPLNDWRKLSLPVQEFAKKIEKAGDDKILNTDFYLDEVFANAFVRKLGSRELNEYKKPFKTPESRRLIVQYLHDLPMIRGESSDVYNLIARYSKWLQQSNIPKLLFYSIPGFLTTMETVSWAREHLSNLTCVEIEETLHYAPESEPELVSEQLDNWYQEISEAVLQE